MIYKFDDDKQNNFDWFNISYMKNQNFWNSIILYIVLEEWFCVLLKKRSVLFVCYEVTLTFEQPLFYSIFALWMFIYPYQTSNFSYNCGFPFPHQT